MTHILQWAIGVGGIGFLALTFGAIFKAWSRVDARNDKLIANQEVLLTQAKDQLAEAFSRIDALEQQHKEAEERRRTNLSVISLLFRAVHRLDPVAPELTEARQMLTRVYGVDPETPEDMLAMLQEIDRAKPRRAKG